MKPIFALLCLLLLFACNGDRGDSLSIPSAYDLRDHQLLSPVKNQNGLDELGNSDIGSTVGICWAFASLASLESNLLKQNLVGGHLSAAANLSAWYLGNHIGYNQPCYNFNPTLIPDVQPATSFGYLSTEGGWGGGGAFWAADFLIRGSALPSAFDIPMPTDAMTNHQTLSAPPELFSPQYLIKANPIYVLEDFSSIDEYRKALKRHILQHGAVQGFVHLEPIDMPGIQSQSFGGVLYEGSRFVDKSNSDMFTYELANLSTVLLTHAICIAGWDDKRKITVNGHSSTGAWLIKDSQAESSWDEGYFWVAFDDPAINIIASGLIAAPADSYQHQSLYQSHAGALSRWNESMNHAENAIFDLGDYCYLLHGNQNQESWAFATIALDRAESLAAVGIVCANRNEKLQVFIYRDSHLNEASYNEEFVVSEVGYTLLELKQEQSFQAGETVVIGIKFLSGHKRLPLVYVQNSNYSFHFPTYYGRREGNIMSLEPFSNLGDCAYFIQAVMR